MNSELKAIKRYAVNRKKYSSDERDLKECSNGTLVLYSDHVEALSLARELAEALNSRNSHCATLVEAKEKEYKCRELLDRPEIRRILRKR